MIKEYPLKKEQLRVERRFIEYCNYDAYTKKKIGVLIESNFLRAAEEDGLLVPLLKLKEKVQKENGKEAEEIVNYYSPFQIFIVAALSRNVVDEGHLHSPDSFEWHKRQGHHSIAWGEHGSFNIELAKERKEFDYLLLSQKFHCFISFLHGLEQTREYDYIKENRQRLFTEEYPHLNFDFRPVENVLSETLKKYGLNEKELNRLRAFVGQYVHDIDPLGDEEWYYFLQHLPQWRKDKLQGRAMLAQELYRLDDLITDVLKMLTGKEQRSLPEFLYPNIKPFGISEIEYHSGADYPAIEKSLSRLKEWLADKKNKKLLDDLMNKLSPSELQQARAHLEKIEPLTTSLEDFGKRYGKNRGYLSGVSRYVEFEDIPLDALDAGAKRIAESLISQHENFRTDSEGKKHFITSYDEIMERLEKKEITLEQAIKEDSDLERRQAIAMGIEHRLRDVQREIWVVAANLAKIFRPEIEELRRKKEEASNSHWRKFYTENPEQREVRTDGKTRYTEDYQKRAKRFMHTELPKKLLPFDKKMRFLEEKQKELGEIRDFGSLFLCSICKKSPVQLHYGHNDRQIVVEPICDECLKKGETVDSSYSSWYCDYCGKLLYRFANRNILHSKLLNQAEARIILEYGQITLQGKCTGCGNISQRTLDWGWQS